MPAPGGPAPSPTNADRRDLYQRRSQASLRLLAALGGLSVIATGDLAGAALDRWWPPVVVTTLLATGATLGLAWSSFSYAEALLSRLLRDDAAAAGQEWARGQRYDPDRGERLYKTGTVLLAAAGVVVLLAFWASAACAG